jgi:anti-anti-sigma regulatory factor
MLTMLKITVLDSGTERRLVVEGALAGPWVAELESVWRKAREAHKDQRVVVDLGGTTLIDPSGKRVLMAMASEGAELVAKGVYTEYVVKGLVDGVNAGCRS